MFFACMALLKYSGAAIYATNSPTLVEKMNPVWQEMITEDFKLPVDGNHARFHLKIGGDFEGDKE
jgi:hypothetical protein